MNIGALLDFVAGELDAKVVGYMQEFAIPASLMDKVLDGIQSHVRQIKAEEYAQELTEMTLNAAVQAEQNAETTKQDSQNAMQPVPEGEKRTGTIEEFKKEFKDVIEQAGEEENADV